mmetsp:Transcript_4029/g.11261  ORF Transcript_4029/g.11261 Transcript_4029/m.11261 type:complete len:267 (-) Transcript_4029:1034-1834(-)
MVSQAETRSGALSPPSPWVSTRDLRSSAPSSSVTRRSRSALRTSKRAFTAAVNAWRTGASSARVTVSPSTSTAASRTSMAGILSSTAQAFTCSASTTAATASGRESSVGSTPPSASAGPITAIILSRCSSNWCLYASAAVASFAASSTWFARAVRTASARESWSDSPLPGSPPWPRAPSTSRRSSRSNELSSFSPVLVPSAIFSLSCSSAFSHSAFCSFSVASDIPPAASCNARTVVWRSSLSASAERTTSSSAAHLSRREEASAA